MALNNPSVGLPGYRHIWNISYPVMIGMLAQNIIGASDTAFLGRVGEVELGAAALGSMYYLVLCIIGYGYSVGAQIIMSRRIGEKRFRQVGDVLHHTLYFFVALFLILFFLSKYFQHSIIQQIVESVPVSRATGEYVSVRVHGLIFAYLGTAYRAFHISRGYTQPILWNAVLVAVLNIALNYLLIFGSVFCEPMGIRGAALASVLSEGLGLLFYWVHASHKAIRRKYHLYGWARPKMHLIKSIFRVSSFVMVQYFLSMGTWFGFFLIIEKTGSAELASTNIVRSIYSLIGIPIWAFFSTIITLVSQAFGQGQVGQLFPLIRRVGWMAVCTSLLMNILVWAFPHQWLALYTNDQGLRALSLESLYVITLAHTCFALGGVVFHAVSGTGKTRVALGIEVSTLVLYVLFLILFRSWFAERIAFAWFSELVYSLGVGLFSWVYLRKIFLTQSRDALGTTRTGVVSADG